MHELEQELKRYGLKLRHSDAPDALPIDFVIEDGTDNVAWVWGNNPQDIDWECNHPEVEFEKDEPIGECLICGTYCNAMRERDGELVPNGWIPRKSIGGWIEKYLKELTKETNSGSK